MIEIRFQLGKGIFINDVRSRGEDGLSSADILRTRVSSSNAYVRTFGAKKFGIFEIYGVSTIYGLKQCGQGGERVNILRFFEHVFYGWPLAKLTSFCKKKNKRTIVFKYQTFKLQI